jgi:uncharacterized membrane protein
VNTASTRLVWATGLVVGLLALALRFYRLDWRSLWLDEIFQAGAAHVSSPALVVALVQADVDQMPLFYLFTWLLRRWGDGAFVLRLPAAIAGALAVVAIFVLGRSLLGSRGGMVAALLMAVMPYSVWYSQEARHYALFMLLTIVQMYFAFAVVKRGRPLDWLGLAIFTIFNLYTHYLALETTTAVLVFVGGFILVELLGRASRAVKAAAAVLLVFGAALAALVHWRPLLRTLYLGTVDVFARDLHTAGTAAFAIGALAFLTILVVLMRDRSRVTKAALAAACLVLTIVLVLVRWIGPPIPLGGQLTWQFVGALLLGAAGLILMLSLLVIDLLDANPHAVRQLAWATAAAVLVIAAYIPWLPSLRVFLGSNKSFARVNLQESPNLGLLAGIPVRLGLSGFLLVVFCLGLVALGAWTFRGRTIESTLVLAWLAVPLTLLLVSVRWAIVDVDLRYFAFLFPAAMLVAAAGVEAICRGVNAWTHSTRVKLPIAAGTASLVLLVGLLLAQALPALGASYQAPKDDWRATAQHIMASSGRDSTVLAVGSYSDWAVMCLHYYFRELHSSIVIVDGLQVNNDMGSRLLAASGPTWGVIDHPAGSQLALLSQSGEPKEDFVDATGTIHVVRSAASGLSALDQARAILRWELPLEPQLGPSLKLLDGLAGPEAQSPTASG